MIRQHTGEGFGAVPVTGVRLSCPKQAVEFKIERLPLFIRHCCTNLLHTTPEPRFQSGLLLQRLDQRVHQIILRLTSHHAYALTPITPTANAAKQAATVIRVSAVRVI